MSVLGYAPRLILELQSEATPESFASPRSHPEFSYIERGLFICEVARAHGSLAMAATDPKPALAEANAAPSTLANAGGVEQANAFAAAISAMPPRSNQG